MDISLILLILGFVVVTFLIFKFIKKVVVAIFSFVFLILIIVGSVFGLVYLDFNYLAGQSDFDVNLIYGSSESANFGVNIPVMNKTPELVKVKSFDVSSLNDVDLDSIKDDFYFFVGVELFESMLDDTKDYYLIGTKGLVFSGVDVDAKLTKEEVLNIMNSKDSLDTYVDILFKLNGEPEVLGVSMKSIINDEIEAKLDEINLDLNEALFVSVMEEFVSDTSSAITLIQGFKDEKFEVYPDRFTFKLVRMLPVDTLVSFIPTDVEISE